MQFILEAKAVNRNCTPVLLFIVYFFIFTGVKMKKIGDVCIYVWTYVCYFVL